MNAPPSPEPVPRVPTGYMGAEMCDIVPGDTIAVWGCGPVGLFAIMSAHLLGAERVIAIEDGDIDPTLVITHRLPLEDAARGYEIFLNKEDDCEKVVLSA